jgi:Kae1-associated kinase Bud32
MKGAEATLSASSFLGIKSVDKVRLKKNYRASALDEKIREERTRREARLLSRAKAAGVFCPALFAVGKFSICMKFLEGEMLHHALLKREITSKEISQAAEIASKLHSKNIMHGDFTPANLMLTPAGMAVIDFGLGSISTDVEDKATDVLMMKKALGSMGGAFVKAYAKAGGNARVALMVFEIEKRARYMERG